MVVNIGILCSNSRLFTSPSIRALINRFKRYDDFVVVVLGDRCTLEGRVERWPIVDFLLCFYSDNLDISNAERYVNLRNVRVFNDLSMLGRKPEADRQLLVDAGVPVCDASLWCNKQALVPAERRVKVYTVGPEYAHARTSSRRIILLSGQEKELARRVTEVLRQAICGFWLMRGEVKDTSVVCGTGTWPLAKQSPKYYGDFVQVVYDMVQYILHPEPHTPLSHASVLTRENEGISTGGFQNTGKELRVVLAVIRHGDRTPKQKVKVKVTHPLILQFFAGLDPHAQVKLKSAKELEQFSAAVSRILDGDSSDAAKEPAEAEEALPLPARSPSPDQHRRQARNSYCKPKYRVPSRSSSPRGVSEHSLSPTVQPHSSSVSTGVELLDENARASLREIRDELGGNNTHFSGIHRKVQIKPLSWRASQDGTQLEVSRALLIFKYGGTLTSIGVQQADYLGKQFRQKMYPPERIGMLSLHSSFSHDVKFYASDEGRVQMTAAVFAKAFLELDETEIIPILYALVWNDKRANLLLEHSCSDSQAMMQAKRQLASIMNADIDLSDPSLKPGALIDRVAVEELQKLNVSSLGNPTARLRALHSLLGELVSRLDEAVAAAAADEAEEVRRVAKQWGKLCKAFYDEKTRRFDISKVPEIADCARYHVLHSSQIRVGFSQVYDAVLPLAMWVVPQEYGVSEGAKLEIAGEVVGPLVEKILSDLRQMRERRQLQTVTRFYFTSESHLNSLHNLVEARLGYPISGTRLEDYIAHFVFKMYEDLDLPISDPRRFVVEVWHSSGSNALNVPDPPGNIHTFCLPLKPIALNMPLDRFLNAFS